jgi:hypothetical protein
MPRRGVLTGIAGASVLAILPGSAGPQLASSGSATKLIEAYDRAQTAYSVAIACVHQLEALAPPDVLLVEDTDSVLRADPSRADAIARGDAWSAAFGLDNAIAVSNAALAAANQAELAILRAKPISLTDLEVLLRWHGRHYAETSGRPVDDMAELDRADSSLYATLADAVADMRGAG